MIKQHEVAVQFGCPSLDFCDLASSQESCWGRTRSSLHDMTKHFRSGAVRELLEFRDGLLCREPVARDDWSNSRRSQIQTCQNAAFRRVLGRGRASHLLGSWIGMWRPLVSHSIWLTQESAIRSQVNPGIALKHSLTGIPVGHGC